MKDLIWVSLFICLSFLSKKSVYGQERIVYKGARYYSIPAKYLHSANEKNIYSAKLNHHLPSATYVDNLIESDGSDKDFTEAIQRIIDHNRVVVLPNRQIRISDKGIRLRSGQVLIFQENTKLMLSPTAKSHFAVIIIDEIENVKVFNPYIIGERFEHLGSKGQWGMGIRIISSRNVEIVNPHVSEMWGDGIYIGGRKRKPSENINIYNAHLDNNRRNAISITSAEGVQLVRPLLANANGQNPKAGIDIEPNSNDDIINNIYIDRPICFYNDIYGIAISLTRLPGIQAKETNIVINKPLIVGGKYGVAVLGIYKNPNNYKIKGTIIINDLTTYFNALTIKEFSKPRFDIQVKVSNMQIFHKSKRGNIYLNRGQLNKFTDNLEILN